MTKLYQQHIPFHSIYQPRCKISHYYIPFFHGKEEGEDEDEEEEDEEEEEEEDEGKEEEEISGGGEWSGKTAALDTGRK